MYLWLFDYVILTDTLRDTFMKPLFSKIYDFLLTTFMTKSYYVYDTLLRLWPKVTTFMTRYYIYDIYYVYGCNIGNHKRSKCHIEFIDLDVAELPSFEGKWLDNKLITSNDVDGDIKQVI